MGKIGIDWILADVNAADGQIQKTLTAKNAKNFREVRREDQ